MSDTDQKREDEVLRRMLITPLQRHKPKEDEKRAPKEMKFLLPLLFALAACDDRPRQWDAFIYPGPGLLEFERIAGFKTFELCQQAAIDRIQSLPDPDAASYECGYMCRYDPQMDINICKETRD